MEKNKKIYKFTSIISITIVLTLMLNLILPKFTIADNEYRLSLNYNTESKELVAQANIAEEWVNNSTLYWIKTTEEVPSKDDLDKVADWCIMNSISDSVTLDSVNVYKTFKPKTDGQYYVAILIKEQDENGAEVYKKALIASYTSNGIIGKDLDDIKGDNQGTEPGGDQKDDNQGTEPGGDPKDDNQGTEPGGDQKDDNQGTEPGGDPKDDNQGTEPGGDQKDDNQGTEPGGDPKDDNQGTEPGGDQKDDNQGTKPGGDPKDDNQGTEPGGDPKDDNQGTEPGRDPKDDNQGTEPGGDPKDDNQGTKPSGDQNGDDQGTKPSEDPKDDELHVDINKNNNKKDDYENLEDDVTKDLIDNKNDNNTKTPEKKDETIIEDKTPLNEANAVNKSKENIPQTGTNDSLVIIAMIMFSIIGMASFIRYKTIK